jgi:hypothetical protein
LLLRNVSCGLLFAVAFANLSAETGSFQTLALRVNPEETNKARTAPFVQQFRVTVPGPRPVLPKLTVTFLRWFPLGPYSRWTERRVPVPLFEPFAMNGLEGRFVGAIRNDAGSWANVYWEQKNATFNTSPSYPTQGFEPSVFVDPLPMAGKYEGELTLAQDPEKVTVGLPVLAKDMVIFPIMVMILGTLLAYRVKRYIGVLRSTWSLRELEAELGAAFRKSQQEFLAASHGQPFASYSIAADLVTQRRGVLGRIKKLERGWTTTLDTSNTDYVTVVKVLQSLQATIAAWPHLAEGLSALSGTVHHAIQSIGEDNGVHPDPQSPHPKAVSDAMVLLQGKPITTSEVPDLATRVSAAAVLLEQWLAAWADTRKLDDAVGNMDSLRRLTESQKAEVKVLQQKIVELRVNLWATASVSDLSNLVGFNGLINNARVRVARLEEELQNVEAAEGMRPLSAAWQAERAQTPDKSWLIKTTALRLEPDDERRAAQLQTVIQRSDLAATILAAIIGLLTGLNAFYFGRPFGTLQDDIALFLWAAGTKAVLDLVLGVVDKFAGPVGAR